MNPIPLTSRQRSRIRAALVVIGLPVAIICASIEAFAAAPPGSTGSDSTSLASVANPRAFRRPALAPALPAAGSPQNRPEERRTRSLGEVELRSLLDEALEKEVSREAGDLKLRLVRPWVPVTVPDAPLTLKIVEMPTAGISPNFIMRIELWTDSERLGSWQLVAQAKLWREVLVARSALKRGQRVVDLDLATERRDVLTLREPLDLSVVHDSTLELTENLSPGSPLLARSIQVRPLIRRGRVVDAVAQDGNLSISIKVEVLEDALPGQTVRIRNQRTRREFFGKVENEQTIVVAL